MSALTTLEANGYHLFVKNKRDRGNYDWGSKTFSSPQVYYMLKNYKKQAKITKKRERNNEKGCKIIDLCVGSCFRRVFNRVLRLYG